MSFRENLRFLMESQDIQTKELADRTGISENTIKSYLKEDSAEPKVGKAIRIAEALDVSVEFLVTGKDNISDISHPKDELKLQQEVKFLSQRDKTILLAAIKAMKT